MDEKTCCLYRFISLMMPAISFFHIRDYDQWQCYTYFPLSTASETLSLSLLATDTRVTTSCHGVSLSARTIAVALPDDLITASRLDSRSISATSFLSI